VPEGMRAPTSPVGTPDRTGGLGYGGALLTEWTEQVPDLTWPESVRTYGRMRRDAKITAVLRAMFLPIIRATWAVDPEGVTRDESVQLVASDLGLPVLGEKDDPRESPILGFSWPDHVRMALLSLVYGHMPFEQWYDIRGGRTHLAGVQERMPHTISEMDIGDNGQMIQVFQNTQDRAIAANRLMWYVNEREGANWAGTSLLRPCYTPWVLKHETMRVHATSIRRFGMGVPNVIAPPGATPAQIAEAQRMASGMRAGDESGAGLPDGYEFRLTGLTGAAPDALGFLGYLDEQITGSALASIVELAHSTYGSKALGESFLDLFLLALQAAADLVGEAATFGSPTMPGISRSLTEYNWGLGEPVPRIVCTDVGDRHEITSTAIQLLISCGALTPDDVLEGFIRNAWGLPEKPGVPGTPPAAGEAGPPVPGPAGQPGPPSTAGPGQGGQAQTPPPREPGGGPPAPAAARFRRGRRARGAASRKPRRDMTLTEAAAGLDPDGMTADLTAAADRLAGLWGGVLRAQRKDLAGQVAAHVDDGDLAALAQLTAPPAGGPDLLAAAMTDMAWTAARRACDEAAGQRVYIDPARIRLDEGRLAQVATARAALAGQQLETAASRRALRVVSATAGDDAGDDVEITLAGLSTTPLADQLTAALSAAVNAGRSAAFQTAEDDGAVAVYTATEILDENTCGPCLTIDGTDFGGLDEATAAYVNGGYVDCEGELRCRGTFIASYPDALVIPPGEPVPEPEGPEDRTIGSLMDAADAAERPLPDDLVGRLNGPYGDDGLRAEIDEDASGYSRDSMRITGQVLAADGSAVGAFTRTVSRTAAGLRAENTALRINQAHPGQGFTSAFDSQMDREYLQTGISDVSQTATGPEVYSQARRGFDFAGESDSQAVQQLFRSALNDARAVGNGALPRPTGDDAYSEAVRELIDDPNAQEDLADLLDRARLDKPPFFGDDDYPYPFEFSTIGWFPGATTWPGKLLLTGSTGVATVKPL
jgi:hypothetical protein